jgi:Fe-S-cluster containining protein
MVMTHPFHTLGQLLAELNDLRARADASFRKVVEGHPEAVACASGCDDCCHALFDLSLLEALSLALAFQELPRAERREIRRRGEKSAQIFDKAAAQALAAPLEGRMRLLSQARVPCPLLSDGRCLLYRDRPLTCRLYGVPVGIDGTSRTCHRSRFLPGRSYPTVDMALVQMELERLSRPAARLLPSLGPARRDVARALELAYTHGPALRSLTG